MDEQNCYNIDIHECIKKKAYKLWEKDGRKDGFDLDYWLAAEMRVKSPDEAMAAKKFKQWRQQKSHSIEAKNQSFCRHLGRI